MGEVCHGLEIIQTSINGLQLSTAAQMFTASGLECAGGTYQLPINTALEQTNLKFERRFRWIERRLEREGQRVDETGSERLEQLWNASKDEAGPTG